MKVVDAVVTYDRIDELARSFLDEERENPNGRLLLFLVRALKSARGARALFDAGHELEVMTLCRTVVEVGFELMFVVVEPDQTEPRLDLFYGHGAFRQLERVEAWANLHGYAESHPDVVRARGVWAQVASNYSRRRRPSWHREFDSLWARVEETQRVMDSRLQESSRGIRPNMYRLLYAEGCAASHADPLTFLELTRTMSRADLGLEPQPCTDGRSLHLVAAALALVLGNTADHLGRSDYAKDVIRQVVETPVAVESASATS